MKGKSHHVKVISMDTLYQSPSLALDAIAMVTVKENTSPLLYIVPTHVLATQVRIRSSLVPTGEREWEERGRRGGKGERGQQGGWEGTHGLTHSGSPVAT